MIPENTTPALFGKVPPASMEDAVSRIAELVPAEGEYHERFVGVVFQDATQVSTAFKEAGFFVTKTKKPVVNAHSVTEWMLLTSKVDGREIEILVNSMGYATILNAVQIAGPKV